MSVLFRHYEGATRVDLIVSSGNVGLRLDVSKSARFTIAKDSWSIQIDEDKDIHRELTWKSPEVDLKLTGQDMWAVDHVYTGFDGHAIGSVLTRLVERFLVMAGRPLEPSVRFMCDEIIDHKEYCREFFE